MPRKKSPIPTINNSRPPTDNSRPLRRLPSSWKKSAHPPPNLPKNYPRLLELPAVRPLVEAAAVDGVLNDIALLSVSSSRSSSPSPPSPPPPRTPTPLAIALRSPAVTKLCVPRSTNAHLLLAQRGDAILRSLLLDIGEELGLTLSGRHVRLPSFLLTSRPLKLVGSIDPQHLVAQVGSNATLAQICLESGVLDSAIDAGTRRVKVDSVHLTAAAGIFEAVAAALHDELGKSGGKGGCWGWG